MIDSKAFWQSLKARGFDVYSGVPDSTFGPSYNALLTDPEITYVPAIREDVALGIASAAFVCKRRGAVLMQNSGLGNIVNTLTSFNLIYRIPALLIIGWRGYEGSDSTAPEHSIMGEKTTRLLSLLGLPHQTLTQERWPRDVDDAVNAMYSASIPVALLVPPGIFGGRA